jgi:uncharacterized membrane protein
VLYAPVPYLGMTAAIWLGELATESPLVLMYLGRLGGLLLALAIAWQAIRLMPFGRWALFLMAMTPVVAYQRAGMSADSFINAIAMLHLAMVLDLACTPGKKVDGSAIFRLGIVTLALCLCKQAYLLLPLFHIVIPQERFASPAGRRLARYWLPLFGWLMAAWWTATVMQKNYQPMLPGCDAMAQLRWILGHPLQYLLVLGRDLFSNGSQYLHELIGTLGWLDLPASRGLVLGHAILLALVILFDHDNRPRLSPFLRVWAAVILVGSLGMVWTLMYLWWAKVGAPSLPGMQGRYFAPFLPLLPAIFVLPAIKRRDPPVAAGGDAASFISHSDFKSKVEHEGKRAATKPYSEYGEEQHSAADKVTRMIWNWNHRVWPGMMAAYGLALTLESLWRVAGHHYLW